MHKPTIYEALMSKLGREPTNSELKAEVERIKTEGYVMAATRGKLQHQRKRRTKTSPSSGSAKVRLTIWGLTGNKLRSVVVQAKTYEQAVEQAVTDGYSTGLDFHVTPNADPGEAHEWSGDGRNQELIWNGQSQRFDRDAGTTDADYWNGLSATSRETMVRNKLDQIADAVNYAHPKLAAELRKTRRRG